MPDFPDNVVLSPGAHDMGTQMRAAWEEQAEMELKAQDATPTIEPMADSGEGSDEQFMDDNGITMDNDVQVVAVKRDQTRNSPAVRVEKDRLNAGGDCRVLARSGNQRYDEVGVSDNQWAPVADLGAVDPVAAPTGENTMLKMAVIGIAAFLLYKALMGKR